MLKENTDDADNSSLQNHTKPDDHTSYMTVVGDGNSVFFHLFDAVDDQIIISKHAIVGTESEVSVVAEMELPIREQYVPSEYNQYLPKEDPMWMSSSMPSNNIEMLIESMKENEMLLSDTTNHVQDCQNTQQQQEMNSMIENKSTKEVSEIESTEIEVENTVMRIQRGRKRIRDESQWKQTVC